MKQKSYQDKEWLEEHYLRQRLSLEKVGKLAGCTGANVHYWLKRHGIHTRKGSAAHLSKHALGILSDRNEMMDLYYHQRLTLLQVAKFVDCSILAVCNWLDKHQIPRRSYSEGRLGRKAFKCLSDKDWLEKEYIKDDKTQEQIANGLGCSDKTIGTWLRRHEIPTKRGRTVSKLHSKLEFIIDQYLNEWKTCEQIAEELDCFDSTVARHLKRNGIRIRSNTEQRIGKKSRHLMDKGWLEEKYAGERMTTYEIAELIGCSNATISRWLQEHNIPMRTASEARLDDEIASKVNDEEWVREQYEVSSRSAFEIAKDLGCDISVVCNRLKQLEIPIRSFSEQRLDEEVIVKLNNVDWMENQYIVKGKSATQMGNELGVTNSTVLRYLRSHEIPIQQFPNGPTSIEREVSVALDIVGVKHESQYSPDGYRRIYDEFISPDILIEVNGDYWHSEELRPGVAERDAEKAQWAKDNGYRLVTIWEHEISEQGAWSLVIERILPLLES